MVIELQEFERIRLHPTQLSDGQARLLQQRFGTQIDLRWLFDTQQWELAAQGWVGVMMVPGLTLLIRPKLPLHNLYHLLDVAYDLNLHHLPGITHSDSLPDFYARLAEWLATRILRRLQIGPFQAYEQHTAQLPYVRGRLQMRQLQPHSLNVPVTFSELSADNPHNQLLLAALHHILRTNLLDDPRRNTVQQAYRQLRRTTRLCTLSPQTIASLSYSRLNADYEQMHLLCRFFLTHTMPRHAPGLAEALPFLIDMAALFERFVAQWLKRHLPDTYQLRVQERSGLADGKIQVAIDLVIVERATGNVQMVLDTKWKSAAKPANDDIYQIAFYANTRYSPQAILIYPAPLTHPLDETIRDVRLRTLVFDVSRPVADAGRTFLRKLLDRGRTNDTISP